MRLDQKIKIYTSIYRGNFLDQKKGSFIQFFQTGLGQGELPEKDYFKVIEEVKPSWGGLGPKFLWKGQQFL